MLSPQGSENIRRRLLATGSSQFDEGYQELEGVPDELEKVRAAFTSLGYTDEADEGLRLNPDHNGLLKIIDDARDHEQSGDVLVVYYTGHGDKHLEDKRYYLVTSNSSIEKLHRTAVSAEDLARNLVIGSKASQILIILDLCHATAGAIEISDVVNELTRSAIGPGPCVRVIAASRIKQKAQQGALVRALTQALANDYEQYGGKTQKHLLFEPIMLLVKELLAELCPSQQINVNILNFDGAECLLFPNPKFQAHIKSGLDLETQAAFVEHWIPKARSAEMGVSGWYFTGREEALSLLVPWLKQPKSDGRARVVTGSAGSGKSALLARLVTLSDPRWRKEVLGSSSSSLPPDTLPPEGVVSAAVVVRRKLLAEVVLELSGQLHMQATEALVLREAIESYGKKTVLVVDALDEADERQKIVDELLLPLAVIPHVFLLVGTRPDPVAYGAKRRQRVEGLGAASQELDLDDPLYGNHSDVVTYVKRRLLATEEPNRLTPYQVSPDRADRVAQAVASSSSHSFLVARTAVTTLLARPDALDVGLPGWEAQLPKGFEEALDQFLQQMDHMEQTGFSGEIARAVLLPLAFAEGEGLPWEQIWAHLASAISSLPINDEQIALLRQQASPFIIEALENGGSVYRLFHERAAEYLRSSVDEGQAHAAIVTALRDLVPLVQGGERLDWPSAHPYIRTHLPAHTLKAGELAKFVSDELFLAACDPQRLLRVLIYLRASPQRAIYEVAFDNLPGHFPQERLAYLELSARSLGFDNVADTWQSFPLDRPWTVSWARWSTTTLQPQPHRRIHTSYQVSTLAMASLAGRPVIVSGGEDSTVRVWDLASGEAIGAPLRGHDGQVQALATASLAGLPVTVSGSVDSTLRVWDLASGEAIGAPLRGHEGPVLALASAMLNGRPVIVSGSDDRTLRVWDLASGEVIGAPLRGHDGRVLALASATLKGRPVIVSGSDDRTLRVWDLARGKVIGRPLQGHCGWVLAVTTANLGGRSVIVSGGDDSDRTLRIWDLASGKAIGAPVRGHRGSVYALAMASLEGRPVIISSSFDGTVRVWDLASGEPIGAPLRVHDDYNYDWNVVSSLATVSLEGSTLVVSNSDDKSMRVWDLGSGEDIRAPLRGHDDKVKAVTTASLEGRPVIVSGSDDRTVRVWDLASGEAIGAPLRGHDDRVSAVTTASLEGRPVIVSGSEDSTVRVWDLASGKAIGAPLRADDWHNPVLSLATASLAGRTVIISGTNDDAVRVWDLASGHAIGALLRGPDERGNHLHNVVLALATASLAGRPVIVSGTYFGTVRVWDLASGKAIGAPLRGHDDKVSAVTTASLGGRPVIVSGSDDRTVRVWDLASGEVIGAPAHRIQIGSPIRGVSWFNDTLVVAGYGGMVAIKMGTLRGAASGARTVSMVGKSNLD